MTPLIDEIFGDLDDPNNKKKLLRTGGILAFALYAKNELKFRQKKLQEEDEESSFLDLF
jgi:hypothetical protein